MSTKSHNTSNYTDSEPTFATRRTQTDKPAKKLVNQTKLFTYGFHLTKDTKEIVTDQFL